MTLKIANRLSKLRRRLAERQIEAILISQPENRHYLSGFDGSAGFLLITPEKRVLATDFRYTEQAQRQAPDYDLFQITGDMEDWLARLVNSLNLRRLGFEAEHISLATYQRLSNILDEAQIQLVPLEELVEAIRVLKEPEEIELITRAVQISDAAFEYILTTIKNGMTEKEVAWEFEKCLHEQGSQPLPFDIIVASGPNSALPHARPSERVIKPGEPVLIDFGAKIGGYSSDISRTICLGKAGDTFKKVYDIVLGAQLKAIAQITAGISGDQADGIARAAIKKAGYGDAFGHGLGHGLGLQTHENPRLGPESTDSLVDGMVFTIEPGIYLPGWGGIRIEDTVVLEYGKIRVLSKAKK